MHKENEGEREIIHPLVCSPQGNNSQVWVRPPPEATDSVLVSHVRAGARYTPHSIAFPGALAGGWCASGTI